MRLKIEPQEEMMQKWREIMVHHLGWLILDRDSSVILLTGSTYQIVQESRGMEGNQPSMVD